MARGSLGIRAVSSINERLGSVSRMSLVRFLLMFSDGGMQRRGFAGGSLRPQRPTEGAGIAGSRNGESPAPRVRPARHARRISSRKSLLCAEVPGNSSHPTKACASAMHSAHLLLFWPHDHEQHML